MKNYIANIEGPDPSKKIKMAHTVFVECQIKSKLTPRYLYDFTSFISVPAMEIGSSIAVLKSTNICFVLLTFRCRCLSPHHLKLCARFLYPFLSRHILQWPCHLNILLVTYLLIIFKITDKW